MTMLEAFKKYNKITRKAWEPVQIHSEVYFYLENTVIKSSLPFGKANAVISIRELEATDWEEFKSKQ